MNKLILLLVIILGLVGCDMMIANNQIGYSKSYKTPMSVSCVRDTLTTNDTFQEFQRTKNGFDFTVNRYKATFRYSLLEQKMYAFDLNIDGTWLGEDSGEFYRNADKILRDITSMLSESCS